ncbi:uncharacterized protein LOC123293191 [Chrysoperla carnea]|uniref:uncharacterized protein LOC123293191 n=1 Tax=Chrysoperla carnea TaxID=189513 RepID=UPI001D08C2DF|nr:uncharacterized protein LOC123293191 [Chrysoperla carnea]
MFKFLVGTLIVCICLTQIAQSFNVELEGLEVGSQHARHIVKRQSSCTPGERYQRDCNTCTCQQDGRSSICTLKACNDVRILRRPTNV